MDLGLNVRVKLQLSRTIGGELSVRSASPAALQEPELSLWNDV